MAPSVSYISRFWRCFGSTNFFWHQILRTYSKNGTTCFVRFLFWHHLFRTFPHFFRIPRFFASVYNCFFLCYIHFRGVADCKGILDSHGSHTTARLFSTYQKRFLFSYSTDKYCLPQSAYARTIITTCFQKAWKVSRCFPLLQRSG